jgi:CubicO group peptidase (beta-lactamase class C family)
MRVVTSATGGSDEPPLPFLRRFMGSRNALSIFALFFATSASAFAEIQADDCERAAKYSETKRGVSMLVLQNGRTIFERYANGGSARGRWPIFSGTKSFWGIVALAGVHDGLFNLDDPVSDTITEWKSDPRKSQITIPSVTQPDRWNRRRFAASAPIDPRPKCCGDSIAHPC